MNERILELAEQAGYTPLPGFDFANELQEVFLNKFAQLIIEECADLVQGVPTDSMGYHTADQKIKQHFGVEG